MSKVKITHIARFAHPHIGGIESVINQINESLPNEEFEKEVFCCSNTDKSSIENGVKYNRCRYLFDFAANSISPQLFFRMMFLKTDIIHFHMPVIQNVVIWFILYHLGLLRYKKMFITYHSDVVGYDRIMKPFVPLYRYFLSKADKIHVLSPNIIESSNMLSAVKNKCVVIPQGISISDKANVEKVNEIRQKYATKKIIFSLGRFVKYKGFIYGIKAMKNIKDAVYLIGGNGPLKSEFEDYIVENDLQDKVILLGRIENYDLASYYKACDIYLFPSIMQSEAFGIVQLEAMTYSKPVINTHLGTGVNYVSLDKETGLTVEPENVEQLTDAINELLNNDELRLQYGRNARERVEKMFEIKKIQQQIMVFMSLVKINKCVKNKYLNFLKKNMIL